MRLVSAWCRILLSLLAIQTCYAARPSLMVDSGECDPNSSEARTVLMTPVFRDNSRGFRAQGTIVVEHSATDAKAGQCRVTYSLFVATRSGPLRKTKQLQIALTAGQIAGIDLIGLSPAMQKFAADFLLAEGDGTLHHPVVYDLSSRQAIDKPLEDRIQNRIHGCDQNEDFIGVTDAGESEFAIPPSIYDDSPECGDKGVWRFNLKTGHVYRIAKISGDKWQ